MKKKKKYFKKAFIKSIEARTIRSLLLLTRNDLYNYISNIPQLKRSDKILKLSNNISDTFLNRSTSINECNLPDAYMHTALILLTIIEMTNNNSIKDGLIFPALFSFRHYLELTIKDSINRFNHNGLNNLVKEREHNLMSLWQELSPYIEDKEDKEIAENLINGFNSIDPKGELFRYPYEIEINGDKISNSLPHGLRSIKEMRTTMMKLYRFLDGINWESYNN